VDAESDAEVDDGGETPETFPVAFMWAAFGDWPPPGRSATATLCACEGPRPPGPELWVEDGPCRLEHDALAEPIDFSRCRPLDFGEIRLEMGASVYPLLPYTAWDEPCSFTFGDELPVPAPGDVLRFVGTGGVDLPAFDVSLVVPVRVTFTEPPADAVLVPGEPWTITWTPTVEAPIVFLFIGRHLELWCEATAVPPVTVPATVTARWDEFDRWASVNSWTETAVEVDAATGFAIRVAWFSYRTVTFAAP